MNDVKKEVNVKKKKKVKIIKTKTSYKKSGEF